MESIYSQLDQHQRLFTQLAIQSAVWYYAFKYAEWHIRTHCTTHKWFIQWSKKPHPLGGKFGDERVIHEMGYFLEVFSGGVFIALGYYLSSPQLFIVGALFEFLHEILDLYQIIKQRYIIKEGLYTAENEPFFGIALKMFHHSGALTVILPSCMYYADNEHVQRAAMGLLGFAGLRIPLVALSSTRNVYDLKERGQFILCFVAQVVLFLYFRWFVLIQGMYGLIREEFPSFSWQLTLLFSVYIICIKLYDVFIVMACSQGLYKWLFTSSAVKSPKITKAWLKRPISIPFDLIRAHSTPLLF